MKYPSSDTGWLKAINPDLQEHKRFILITGREPNTVNANLMTRVSVSSFSITLQLKEGKHKMPFAIPRTLLGSDIKCKSCGNFILKEIIDWDFVNRWRFSIIRNDIRLPFSEAATVMLYHGVSSLSRTFVVLMVPVLASILKHLSSSVSYLMEYLKKGKVSFYLMLSWRKYN